MVIYNNTYYNIQLIFIDNNKLKKPFLERPGDWVCIKCKNLNFAFRNSCNRCHTLKTESNLLFEQYLRKVLDNGGINCNGNLNELPVYQYPLNSSSFRSDNLYPNTNTICNSNYTDPSER